MIFNLLNFLLVFGNTFFPNLYDVFMAKIKFWGLIKIYIYLHKQAMTNMKLFFLLDCINRFIFVTSLSNVHEIFHAKKQSKTCGNNTFVTSYHDFLVGLDKKYSFLHLHYRSNKT